jgi:hypothetical protein
MQGLCSAIIDELQKISQLLTDMDRTVDSIAPGIAKRTEFAGISKDAIVKASSELSAASQGALAFDGRVYAILTSFDELRRRAASLAGNDIRPLRNSTFRAENPDAK